MASAAAGGGAVETVPAHWVNSALLKATPSSPTADVERDAMAVLAAVALAALLRVVPHGAGRHDAHAWHDDAPHLEHKSVGTTPVTWP